ncbi:uncharacterized protein LOC125655298 [Ostrea edulis]|uniref:uncharacterized protein LOC125655298 n=1 Tax=Ostrea edulis TaxID=37623 RepID=UPI0024AF7D9D|nr:uncharacterized protein LOC125655298 [Ostrea edulis]
MVGYRKKILHNSLMFIILLQTGFTRAVKQGRYQRELLFDGVVPKNTSYYSNVFESLTHLACACKCCTNYPICVGYLYSSSLMRCRLLRKFLGESERANDYNGSGWEYRSIEGRWLHNVEIRVGNPFTWSEMELCGLFVGPSQTGKVHTIECGTLLYGTYVTAKMVELNYISDDLVTSVGKDILVLEEIVVNGLFV